MILSIETVSAARAHLWESGFRPVPIINWDAKGPSPGKRPLGDNWRESALKDPPFCVTIPAVPFALNTGILADELRPIDIDIDDPVRAMRVRALAVERFGPMPIRTRGNSARSLLLARAASGQPRKIAITGADHNPSTGNSLKVEVLGAGQQFVALGRHDSGAELQWEPPLAELTRDDLPAITEAGLMAFLAEAALIIDAAPPGYANGHANGQDHYTASDPQADPLRVVAALGAIPNTGPADWESWNRIGMALWAATGGSAIGGEAFNEWSKRHPAYDAAATEERWLHYRKSPPTGIGAGTLFHMAHTQATLPRDMPEPPPPIDDPNYYVTLHDPQMSAEDWAEFEARETGQAVPSSPAARKQAGDNLVWSISEPWNEADIPARPWIAPGYLMRRALTVVSGPGSAGKSSLMVAWGCAMTIGSPFNRLKIKESLRVIVYNVEDDADEQKRRFSGTLRKMGLTTEAVRDHLLILGPSRVGTLLHAIRDGGLLVNTPVFDKIEGHIAEFHPHVLMLDPFVELHQAEENDNTAIRAVMARFRAMAVEYDMSVVILHHARKGGASPGDPDSLRGASSIVSAARVALTLNVMTENEANTFGLPIEKRHNFFRLDRAKSNYAPIEEAEWFERHEIHLENGGDDPSDSVPVVWPWRPPSVWAEHTPSVLNRALDLIAAGPEPGLRYTSTRRGGSSRWAGNVLIEVLGVTEKQATRMIGVWLKSGLLVNDVYEHPMWRRSVMGIRVVDIRRPTE